MKWNGEGIEYDEKGNILFKGEFKNGLKWNGEGIEKNGIGFFNGNFFNGKRLNGILQENGKEYFVEYDDDGIEKLEKRVRTFEGVRIMVIGNEDVGKTSFKTRLISSSNQKQFEESHKKVLIDKKEQDMTHGVGKNKY